MKDYQYLLSYNFHFRDTFEREIIMQNTIVRFV